MKTYAALLMFAMALCHCADVGAEERMHLFVPDGQVKRQPLRVFVTGDLTEDMCPKLVLHGWFTIGQSGVERDGYTPLLVAPHQKWTETVEGQPVTHDGTLLLFDLSGYPMPAWKPMVRLRPILRWKNVGQSEPQTLIGPQEIYLGHMPMALCWTLILEAMIVVLLAFWARAKTGHARYLLCGPDRYYSLWRTQLAAWTLAVGGMVFCFGLIRLSVPRIPESLVVLMGMSLATGVMSSFKDQSNRPTLSARDSAAPQGETIDTTAMNKGLPAFSDLISGVNAVTGQVEISMPKAQMVFWTIVILSLFLAKTFLNGQLWEVPWEMVALTGFSQAGYVTGKLAKPSPS